MSKTRPYNVKVDGTWYMLRATSRDQAIRIVADAFPKPVVEAAASNAQDVLDWMEQGFPVHDKETFAPITKATVVLYVDDDGNLAVPVNDDGFKLEPGGYHLIVERYKGDDVQPASEPNSEAE